MIKEYTFQFMPDSIYFDTDTWVLVQVLNNQVLGTTRMTAQEVKIVYRLLETYPDNVDYIDMLMLLTGESRRKCVDTIEDARLFEGTIHKAVRGMRNAVSRARYDFNRVGITIDTISERSYFLSVKRHDEGAIKRTELNKNGILHLESN